MLYTTSHTRVIWDTENMTVFLPRTGSTDRRVVIYAHGFLGSGVGASLRDRNDTGDDMKALASMGLVVAAPDLGGASTWGNDASWGAVDAALTTLETEYGVEATDPIDLMGDSMGALTVLNWAVRNPSKVRRVALRSPVVNLADFRDRNTGVFGTVIEDAYGGLAAFQAALETHDPSSATNLAIIRQNFGRRIRIWGPVSDDLIPVSELSDFAKATGAQVIPIPGEHADGVDQSVYELTAWIGR